jgi:GNAT superfamily N-acetyltransferase
MSSAKIVARTYSSDLDFASVMRFLHGTFKRNALYENWFPDRFESSLDTRAPEQWARHIRMWERVDDEVGPSKKEIVAVANPEGSPRNYFLQVDPDYSFVEREMLEWIEAHFRDAKGDRAGKENLAIHVLEGNSRREALLTQLGYQKDKVSGLLRMRRVNQPIPESVCPEGYEIRTVSKADYGQLAAAVRLVFGHGEWFNTEVYESITRCSFYLQDLDLIAVARDGTFASFCTFRVDPLSKITNLEPMGTHPDHRRRGLGKALILEGLRRSKRHDPTLFYVGGAADTPAANRLYDSTGYTEKRAYHAWCKEV